MGDVIRRVNEADRLARLWHEGRLPAVRLIERLTDAGWYAVDVGDTMPGAAVAYLNGVRFQLGENP